MILFAFVVDLVIYALLGGLIVHFGKNRLPAPWNQAAVTIPVVMGVGIILSLLTFPHWLASPI